MFILSLYKSFLCHSAKCIQLALIKKSTYFPSKMNSNSLLCGNWVHKAFPPSSWMLLLNILQVNLPEFGLINTLLVNSENPHVKSSGCPSLSLEGGSSDNGTGLVRFAVGVTSTSLCTELGAEPCTEGTVWCLAEQLDCSAVPCCCHYQAAWAVPGESRPHVSLCHFSELQRRDWLIVTTCTWTLPWELLMCSRILLKLLFSFKQEPVSWALFCMEE